VATPPTFPASADLAEGSGTRAFGAVTTQAGDYLVVEGIGDDGGTFTALTPTCVGLTFTNRTDVGQSGKVRVQQWTAPDATGASRTVTITPTGGGATWSARVTVVRGSEGPSGTGTALAAQTASVTRTGDNSAMVMTVGDWATGAVGSPAWTPGGATTASQQGANATYIYGRWDDSGAAGTASHGISSPTYTTPSAAALEMLGTAGSPAAGAAGVVPFPLPPHLLLELAARNQAMWQAGASQAQSSTGTAEATQRSTTETAGLRQGTGTGTAVARTTTQSTGVKGAAGAAAAAQHTTTAGAGQKQATAAANTVQRSTDTDTGSKQAGGPGASSARPLTQATTTAIIGGAGTASAHATTTSTGTRGTTADASTAPHVTTTSAGNRSTSGAGHASPHVGTAADGVRATAGVGRVTVHTVTGSTGQQIAPFVPIMIGLDGSASAGTLDGSAPQPVGLDGTTTTTGGIT